MKNKKWLPLLFAAAGFALLAAGLVFAEHQTGYYRASDSGSLEQPAAPAMTENSVYEVSAYPLHLPDLAEGDGRQEAVASCGLCHSVRYITMQPALPAAIWAAEVNKMRKAYGAAISNAAAEKITRYLQAHYTPEARVH